MGRAYGALGQPRGDIQSSPARRRRKCFFDLKLKTIPYCGLLFEILTDHNMELFSEKSQLTAIWNCFQKHFHIVDYFERNQRFEDFEKIISILNILKFLRIYQKYQKSLRPISQRCRLRHFPEVSTQNSSRCSIHGRTHGRTDATPSENRCSHCFILRVKKFLESNDASYAPFPKEVTSTG